MPNLPEEGGKTHPFFVEYYRGIMSLLVLNGAKDFLADDAIHFHELKDHYIFPKAYLHVRKVKASQINSILNHTLISDNTNSKIGEKAPSKYVPIINPTDRRAEILRSLFIDVTTTQAFIQNRFDEFINRREKQFCGR